MSQHIKSVAVIGAGTMGAGIAAQVANAGYPVVLLDIVPNSLTPKEEAKGLTLGSPAVRNRIVQGGLDRAMKARPASLMSNDAERLITIGNVEDDLDKIADADWIVEAIIEKVEPKQAMMARIEAARKPGSIVTSNSSGLPMATVSEGRSDDFKAHFLGTHFFNPPRYMKLLEVIPTEDTDESIAQTISEFVEETLGKGVVVCKDTPNFIGNRLFSIGNSSALLHGIANGYTVSEVDTLTGPLVGRPKTGTFRLQDLVGIDVAAFVAQNLHDLIPHDPHRDILRSPVIENVLGKVVENGWLGNKSGQGFYKKGKDEKGKRVFMELNLETFEYEIPEKVRFESVGAVRKIEDLGQRLTALFDDKWKEDRAAQYVWSLVNYELAYASYVAQEIAHDIKSIDDAMRWGFGFEAGPFELWDKLGVATMVEKMEDSDRVVADWVKDMLAAGCDSFYQVEDGRVTGYYDWESKGYKAIPVDAKHIKIGDLQSHNQTLHTNESASIHAMGDGVLLLEFHAKMNAIDDKMVAMMQKAQQMLDEEDQYVGLVIGNEGENFCVGANIFVVAMAGQQGLTDQIDQAVKALQDTLTAFRRSAKPVVVAVHNRALGGGAEIVMSGSRVVAHAESYIGLVEVGVGLIPGGSGTVAMVRRILSQGMQIKNSDPLPLAQKIFENIGMAKVGTSAAESRELGFLGLNDRIVMNRDHLLYEAKQEVLSMVTEGYAPEAPAPLYAGGRDLKATIKMAIWTMEQGGYISEHDAFVGDQLANIIAGGDLSNEEWVDEQYFMDLEREAFVTLASTKKSQERMFYMLQNGKPLRN
ncbi:MAG: 3-hydroxyacyl-CoA dehydrogenase NAD-binding domain-containing protein [Chloroflexota bacterium]